MDQSLLSELRTQATFVAGKGSYLRSENSPEVIKSIDSAEKLLDKLSDNLKHPEVSGGTTANPETILTLFWPVYSQRGIFGITIDFDRNNKFRISWSSPDIKKYTLKDLSFKELMDIDIAGIFFNVELSSRTPRKHFIP